jgi:hypothetical protein
MIKHTMSCTVVLVLLVLTSLVGAQENDSPSTKDPYPGQKRPVNEPVLVAPSIVAISTGNHRSVAIRAAI